MWDRVQNDREGTEVNGAVGGDAETREVLNGSRDEVRLQRLFKLDFGETVLGRWRVYCGKNGSTGRTSCL